MCAFVLCAAQENSISVTLSSCALTQDYETSASTLRLLASDYKQDKAWKYYAGVQVRTSLRLM